MHRLLLLLFVCLFSATGAGAQAKTIEQDYLKKFSASFAAGTNISHRATNLFWSLCLGETRELTNEELSKRYEALITDNTARIAFYRRFNYYLSEKISYYSDLLKLYDEDKNNKRTYVFNYTELRELAEIIAGYKQDLYMQSGWNAGRFEQTQTQGSDTTNKASTIFNYTEELPEFPGGDGELIRFLQKHIIYPEMERDNDIQGRVILQFTVCDDGYLCSAKTMRSVSVGLDTEAIRVLKMMPHWKPGRQEGKNVSVYFNLPIIFKLQ